MCRWLAYAGAPITLEEVLFRPTRSLVMQSLRAKEGAEPTNGDGFGIGWYGRSAEPRLYRSTSPAWNDRNLRELALDVQSRLFLAHVRASTGTAVQQTNCHPFRHGRWLWMHNGLIREFRAIKRELVLAVDDALYPLIEGTTDSELMFFLAITFGLEEDVPRGVQRMVEFVETTGQRHGIAQPMQMTLAVSNGAQLWVFRYSTEAASRSLYYSTDVRALRKLYPDNQRIATLAEETRLVVSEPFADLPGAWNAMPEGSYAVVSGGQYELHAFAPKSTR